MTITKKIIAQTVLLLTGVITLIGGGWFFSFALSPYQITTEQLEAHYAYLPVRSINWQQIPVDAKNYDFTYQSFDGAVVNGRIRYPRPLAEINQAIPVMIGVHGMGRSQIRWFQDSFKGRPTIESVDKITEQALIKGYAVISIDARYHGLRKDPDYTIADVMNDLHYWGNRVPYETMIKDTVRDHRVLLDWISQQRHFDKEQVKIAGYSMGAQVSLLLAGIDDRIGDVAAIVPPYSDNKTALVAPKNLLRGLTDNKVWLVTGNDDEYASEQQNDSLFNAIPTENKKHLRFDSGHLLPAHYVDKLGAWF
jgi:dienelactone hydrolase